MTLMVRVKMIVKNFRCPGWMILLIVEIISSSTEAIQNDPTSSRSIRDNAIMSASVYTGPEKTSEPGIEENIYSKFEITVPAIRLESSRSVIENFNGKGTTETIEDETLDGLTASKHVNQLDGNNIEVKPGEYYRIAVTKSEPYSGEERGAPEEDDISTEPRQSIGETPQQERRPRQETPLIYNEHAPPPVLHTATSGRQANPDIQDIITGIVKLLNGNVNVAANTARPLRPIQATRINNRGPPRIADSPPLPLDFDSPPLPLPFHPLPPSSTPVQDQPYPFEKPPAAINQIAAEKPIRPFMNGVPVPEQLVPPWTKPAIGTRRPVTTHRPLPPLDSSFHRDNHQGSKLGNASDNHQHPKVPSKIEERNETISTLKIETSSSVQVLEPTTTTTTTSKIEESTVALDLATLAPSPTWTFDNDSTTSKVSTPTLVLEVTGSTSVAVTSTTTGSSTSVQGLPPVTADRNPYRPRPGIVLDDTLDYAGSQNAPTQRPYAPPRYPPIGDIFDVTVSAIQGPGTPGESVKVPINAGNTDIILTSAVEGQGFVSIDGKRTYLNLFDTTDSESSEVQTQATKTQYPAVVETRISERPSRRPTFHRRPTQPPIRIDTCIVGDPSTCEASQHEACATVQGVSACHCKPGYARLQHSLPCKKIVSIVVSMRVDKIYDKKIIWDERLADKDSESYQTLAYEANRAIESAMSMTPFSDEYMGSLVNNVYEGDVSQGRGGVFVNATLKLIHEQRTSRPSLAGELQRHLLGVIHRRNNNIGNSALFVDSPPGSISNLQDLDECASSELNDCHSSASCGNSWGGFACACNPGFKDPHKDDPNDSGRSCLSCPSTHCNNRGTCSYRNDQMQCACVGNYYGTQCEVDGEVLSVTIGACVAALVVIALTLAALIVWSRRWSREQKAMGSPLYGYIQGGIHGTLPGTSIGTLASVKQGPPTGLPPYMWARFGDHIAPGNLYATEPMGPTRPGSTIFGYPTMNVHGTLPPVPLPRLQAPPRPRQRQQLDPDSSDSELQDKDRADLIPQSNAFHVPRPKSRSSLANQSGIYNDVEYDQGDVQHLSKNNIPMSTYRPYYRT